MILLSTTYGRSWNLSVRENFYKRSYVLIGRPMTVLGNVKFKDLCYKKPKNYKKKQIKKVLWKCSILIDLKIKFLIKKIVN